MPCRRTVNMIYKRVCRDCPIPGCGAKYLVRLANHLADVHQLDHTQRRKYLQEAKLQPNVKVVIYDTEKSKRSGVCSTSETSSSTLQEQHRTVYHLSTRRKPKGLPRFKASGVGKKKAIKGRNIYLLSGLLINDRRKNILKSVKQFITPQIARMNQIQVRNIASLLSL